MIASSQGFAWSQVSHLSGVQGQGPDWELAIRGHPFMAVGLPLRLENSAAASAIYARRLRYD